MIAETESFPSRVLRVVRKLLPLARFDLFLQGALLILIFFDGVLYQLLKRSAAADLLTTNISQYVFMGVGGAEVVFGSLVGWLGTRKRQYWISVWLFLCGFFGLLVLIFPQAQVEMPEVETCNGNVIVRNEIEPNRWIVEEEHDNWLRTTIIIITIIFNALSRLSVYALGITYLDAHDPAHTPLYLGIQVTIRLSMSINAQAWMGGPVFGEYWFRPQVSMACLILLLSFLFTLFPNPMPGYKVPEIPEFGMGYFNTMKRVLTNKTVVIQTIALSFLNTALWGYIKHEYAYTQSRFYVPAASRWGDGWTTRLAADFLRTFIIVYCMGVFRTRFSGRRHDGVKATTAAKVSALVATVAAVFFLAVTFIQCPSAPLKGLQGSEYTQPECSHDCGCESERYGFAPVCDFDDRKTYFSPCHAGCSDYENYNGVLVFNNCTCAERVISSACDVSSCYFLFAIYTLIYYNALALCGGSLLMQTMVILRAVEPHDKPTAVGASFSIVALFAYLPGHYLYMFINEATCAWMDDRGVCQLHSKAVAPILTGVTSALIFISAIISIFSFIVQRRSCPKTAL